MIEELEARLTALVADLDQIDSEYKEKTALQEIINAKIAELRKQADALAADRQTLRSKRRDLSLNRDSLERQVQLAKEQRDIEEKFKLLIERAEQLIADAPWRNGGLKLQIMDHQVKGATKLAAAKRALCGDKRGLGKTLQALAWRRMVEAKKTLFLTRKEYARRLAREVNFWEPNISVVPFYGMQPQQRTLFKKMLQGYDEFILVANFEMWRRNIDDTVEDLLEIGFDAVIVDEAHNLKTVTSATTKGFFKIAEEIPCVLEMTGSPIQNRPPEMFALLHPLYPDLFPKPSDFVRDYCYQVAQNRWVWRPGGAEALAKKTEKFFIARDYKDVGIEKMPFALSEDDLTFEGYPKQHKVYRQMVEMSLAELEDGRSITIPGMLALMTRLAQCVSWPAGIVFDPKDENGESLGTPFRLDVHESAKLDWAENLIKELVDEGQRAVLFSRFIEPIVELQRRLLGSDINAALIKGGINKDLKEEIEQDFDLKTADEYDYKYPVLVATYDTVSESVDLNAARHLVQLDRYWKPSRDDQAIGRIDRLNNTDAANVYRATVEGSIDEYMNSIIEEKTAMLHEFRSVRETRDKLKEHLEATLW